MSRPDFEPEMKIVTNVTTAQNAVVTTLTPHGYTNNQTICLIVPNIYEMHIDYREIKITITGLNTFITNMDTSQMDPFVTPVSTNITPAHCCPVTQVEDNVAVF